MLEKLVKLPKNGIGFVNFSKSTSLGSFPPKSFSIYQTYFENKAF